jgi:hypothetical protein
MKKKHKIKNEKIFVWFYQENYQEEVVLTEIGRNQFYENQTFGKCQIHSKDLDPYFYVLYYGKRSFDHLTREYQQLYEKRDEWWGLHQIWEDWKGHRWILPKLLKWYPKELPKWITEE